MGDYCRKKAEEYRSQGYTGRFEVVPERLGLLGNGASKRKFEEETADVLVMRCAFLRSNYADDQSLPKTQLINWTRKQKIKLPSYSTVHEDKLFRSVVVVDGKKYGSSFW